MKKGSAIESYSVEELRTMVERGGDGTDWARVLAMTEDELEAAIASDPDWAELPRDWYKDATSHYASDRRRRVTLHLDPDVLAWFKGQGRGYQGAHQRGAARLRRGPQARLTLVRLEKVPDTFNLMTPLISRGRAATTRRASTRRCAPCQGPQTRLTRTGKGSSTFLTAR